MLSKRNLNYLFSLIPAVLVVCGNLAGGWYTLMNFAFSLVLLGALELVLGSDTSNIHSKSDDPFPEAILYAHVILHTAAWVSLFFGIYSGRLQDGYIFTAALSSGIEAGSGAVVIAHELVHKINPVKRGLGKYLLATSGNTYFYVHHLRIHHRYVGLDVDAATARRGESLYRFFARTVGEQFLQAWQSEKERLGKKGRPVLSLENEMILNLVWQLLLVISITVITGWKGFSAYILYVFIAALLLEYVNYIEHYGLKRNPGEKVDHRHSWNSDKRVSRFMLIDLSRHADHHYHPSRPYHTLNTTESGPVLPGGYASLIVPALVPKWWFKLLHKRLDQRTV